MREYHSSDIRNVAVIGHGASGKTTLVDALAFAAGATRRHGSVRDGTALTDYAAEATERKHSVALGCACAEWLGAKINFVDTPGFADFQGDAVAGLAAADGALLCVPATGAVEVGTERMFAEAVARRDPVLFVVTMLDREHASFDRAYESIKARLTPNVIPVEIPVGEGAANRGVINLFARRAYLYERGDRSGEYVEAEIPDADRARFERYHAELIEAVSATDDALLERYLDGAEIGRDEAIAGMKEAMKRGSLYPVFCASGETMVGVRALLTEIVQLMPSAYEMEELHMLRGAEGDRAVEIHALDDAPFSALVFKTQSEPHVGDVSFFRIFSGTVTSGQELFNATRGAPEKAGHLAVAVGRERVEVPRLHPGDIGCVAKLRDTHTNDTLATREHPVRLPGVAFPPAVVAYAVHPAVRGEEEKLHAALQRLHDEDPTVETRYDPETRETIVSGLGERHLEVAMARLRRKYGVRAELRRPRVAYRETVTALGTGQGRHKKQSGGRGQFGDCWVRVRPGVRGAGYRFVDRVVGGAIPSKYIPAVDRGVQEAAARGVLAGYPMVDFEVELYDGSYHAVDSSEMAFKLAGSLAFRTVAQKCRPVLLEPLDEIEVATPDQYLGDVLGDISARRGHILGTRPAPDGRGTIVRASVPQAELHLYATQLYSLTHGRGQVTRQFRGYEPMPADAAQRVIEETQRARAAGA